MRTSPNLKALRVRHIELLTILGEVGTVHGAAARLNITQPAISKMIIQIEDSCGQKLFERSRQGVVPTEAGQMLIRRSRLLISELSSTAAELSAVREGAKALLRLGTLAFPTTSVLDAVMQLRHMMPGVRISIREGLVSEMLSSLLEGELDCFVGGLTPELIRSHSLNEFSYERLYEDQVRIVVSPCHRLLGKRRLTWKDLHSEKWILPPAEGVVRQAVMMAFVNQGLAPPTPEIESHSTITIRSLVEIDNTIVGALRTGTAYPDKSLGLLEFLPVTPTASLPPFSVVTRRCDGPRAPALELFIQRLRSLARRNAAHRHKRHLRSG